MNMVLDHLRRFPVSVALKSVAKLLAGILVAYGLIWMALNFSQPAELDEAPTMELLLPPAGLGVEDVARGALEPFTVDKMETHDGYRLIIPENRATGLYIKTFDLPEGAPEQQLAVHVSSGQYLKGVELNGTPLYAGPSFGSWIGVTEFAPVGFLLPEDLLREGENEIGLIVDGGNPVLVHLTTIGPAEPILRSVHWSDVFNIFLAAASAFALFFVALLFFVVTWPEEDRGWSRIAAVSLISWSICNIVGLGVPPNLPLKAALTLDFVCQFAMMFTFIAFVLARISTPRRLQMAVWGLGALACVIVAIAGSQGLYYLAHYGYPAEMYFKPLMAAGLLFTLLVADLRQPGRFGPVEMGAIAAALTALAIDGHKDIFDQALPFNDRLYTHAYHQPWFGLIFALGLCALLATQASRARRIAVNHTAILQERLTEREAQLAEVFGREKETARQRALIEERQRLMRDMHDGIGGQLVSLIVQSRADELTPPEISHSLSGVLEELHLIVDSLDTAEDTLPFALGAFRHRLEPQLRAAGIALEWDVAPIVQHLDFGPEKTLQILRVLQQACSNAVQHSGAKTLTIRLQETGPAEAPQVALSVIDDGQGMDPAASQGKGMASMRQRCDKIGAAFTLNSAPGQGTQIAIGFPINAPIAGEITPAE
ncbi:MAG: histidine kinase [Hyphomonadaceae bacterium]|nr:histidine kinase [Hyphomonadaceae bacterium]